MVSNVAYPPSAVLDFLSTIPDPEIPVITIRELGMLQNVRWENGQYVVTITPTYTACPAMKMVEEQILALCKAHGISNTRVELTYTPAWSTDWLSAQTKEKLRLYGIAPPQKKACATALTGSTLCCPRCGSRNTQLISRFGSTACKSLHKCGNCLETFESFKCH